MDVEAQKVKPKYEVLLKKEDLDLLDYASLVENNEFEYIYEPNDDTFLMLSVLKQELHSLPPDLFLCQVGSGSGILSANLHHWLVAQNKPPLIHLSVDINMDASQLSQKYYSQYKLRVEQINSSLFNNLCFKVKGRAKPDIIVFNPPYVPVEQEELDNEEKYLKEKLRYVREEKKSLREKEQNMIAYSYMGGLDGLAVTRKFLGQINWSCRIYFIVMGGEGCDQICKEIMDSSVLNQECEFKKEIEMMQYAQFYNEHLFVIRLTLERI